MKRIAGLLFLFLLFLLTPFLPAQDGAPTHTAEGVICNAVEKGAPRGVVKSVFADQKTLFVWFKVAPPPADGTVLRTRLRDGEGTVVFDGPTGRCDGKSDVFSFAVEVAGQVWARNGGTFGFQASLGDAKEPLVDIPFAVETGTRFALIVAIKDYPPFDSPEGDLAGCDVDADAMANLLVSGFGFAAGNVFVLKDKNATRANIAGALVELGKRAGPHDAVLFYYSGHGAQIPDLDGDEEDGWDEAIVPCDPKPARIATEEEMGVFLSDDAMREIFDAYKTKNVTMIFDSCHSGDAIRDATEEAPAEFVQERADRTQWGRELMRQRDDAMEAAGRKRKGDAELDLDTEYVFLSACQSWETAAGSPQGGIFTSVLAPLLLQAQGESWGEIFARARLYVPMRNPGQTPAAMGALRRYPFSLAEAEKDAPYVRPTIAAMGAVEAKRAPNAVAPRLNDGTAGTHEALLSGLASLYAEQIGTTYDVYPRADAGLAGKPTARAVLTGSIVSSAVLDKDGRPLNPSFFPTARSESGAIRFGDRLLPRTVRLPDARPRVGLFCNPKSAGANEAKVAALANRLLTAFDADPNVQLRDHSSRVVACRGQDGAEGAATW
jgi:hypothetical protein